eukprot:753776-Hanusia_phi.AAC.8
MTLVVAVLTMSWLAPRRPLARTDLVEDEGQKEVETTGRTGLRAQTRMTGWAERCACSNLVYAIGSWSRCSRSGQ